MLDVEVTSAAEADEAIDAGADIIMLDNFEGDALVSTARTLKERWRGKRKFLIETSGGIEEGNLKERAINGRWSQNAALPGTNPLTGSQRSTSLARAQSTRACST